MRELYPTWKSGEGWLCPQWWQDPGAMDVDAEGLPVWEWEERQRYQKALGDYGAQFVAFGDGSKDPAYRPVGAGAIIYEVERDGMDSTAAGREVWSMATGCRTYGGTAHSNNMAEGWALLNVLRAVHPEADITYITDSQVTLDRLATVNEVPSVRAWIKMETRWLWKEISDYLQVRGDFGSSFSAIKCWSWENVRTGKGRSRLHGSRRATPEQIRRRMRGGAPMVNGTSLRQLFNCLSSWWMQLALWTALRGGLCAEPFKRSNSSLARLTRRRARCCALLTAWTAKP